MSLDHLWSGWRSSYVTHVVDQRLARDGSAEGSIFQQILHADRPDEETYVVHRGQQCAVLLNIYPYTTGHVMVMPMRAVAALGDLTDDEHAEMWSLVRDAATAIESAFSCDGINIGLNLGEAAGAGVPDHLHVHVLPRWSGDTNFMTTTANTRVLPVSLAEAWERLRAAWPA
jgi:diadenosine tetraphosphate (Ap4A) HIT family hydrolase